MKETVKQLDIAELIPDDHNFNKGSEFGGALLEKSFERFGAGRSILLDKNNRIIAGNKATEKYGAQGGEKVIVVETDGKTLVAVKRTDVDLDSKEGRELALADNMTQRHDFVLDEDELRAASDKWDIDAGDWGVNWSDEGDDESGDGSGGSASGVGENSKVSGILSSRFLVPPFSILDTRQGYWQARKKEWRSRLDLGSGASRKGVLGLGLEVMYPELYSRTRAERERLGISFTEYMEKYVSDEVKEREAQKVTAQNVSLFDPVLSELICKWFTPYEGAKIFDCFAGDTQKGAVFSSCGYQFKGVELRQEQVDENNRVIEANALEGISYVCDDGQNVKKYFEPESQDLLMSCPPYFDIEVYSDLENDASNQGSYEDFLKIIDNAFTDAVTCLKKDRFAVIVIGDIRGKNGGYYDFPADISRIFRRNGLELVNHAILVETVGSNALRAARNMDGRKMTKCHQNVLVFYKGDPRNVKNIFPRLDLSYVEETVAKEEEESPSEE